MEAIIAVHRKHGLSKGRAATLLVESASPAVAITLAKRETDVQRLQQIKDEQDSIIERLKVDVLALQKLGKGSQRSLTRIQVPPDFSMIHPRLRHKVAAALGASQS